MSCTLTWHFFNRNDKLEMIVNMRSWDLVWGLSYDIPCFVAVQMAVADALDLELGEYTHVAGSGHVYERHFDMIADKTTETLPSFAAGPLGWTRAEAGEAVKEFGSGYVKDLPGAWPVAAIHWQKYIDKLQFQS